MPSSNGLSSPAHGEDSTPGTERGSCTPHIEEGARMEERECGIASPPGLGAIAPALDTASVSVGMLANILCSSALFQATPARHDGSGGVGGMESPPETPHSVVSDASVSRPSSWDRNYASRGLKRTTRSPSLSRLGQKNGTGLSPGSTQRRTIFPDHDENTLPISQGRLSLDRGLRGSLPMLAEDGSLPFPPGGNEDDALVEGLDGTHFTPIDIPTMTTATTTTTAGPATTRATNDGTAVVPSARHTIRPTATSPAQAKPYVAPSTGPSAGPSAGSIAAAAATATATSAVSSLFSSGTLFAGPGPMGPMGPVGPSPPDLTSSTVALARGSSLNYNAKPFTFNGSPPSSSPLSVSPPLSQGPPPPPPPLPPGKYAPIGTRAGMQAQGGSGHPVVGGDPTTTLPPYSLFRFGPPVGGGEGGVMANLPHPVRSVPSSDPVPIQRPPHSSTSFHPVPGPFSTWGEGTPVTTTSSPPNQTLGDVPLGSSSSSSSTGEGNPSLLFRSPRAEPLPPPVSIPPPALVSVTSAASPVAPMGPFASFRPPHSLPPPPLPPPPPSTTAVYGPAPVSFPAPVPRTGSDTGSTRMAAPPTTPFFMGQGAELFMDIPSMPNRGTAPLNVHPHSIPSHANHVPHATRDKNTPQSFPSFASSSPAGAFTSPATSSIIPLIQKSLTMPDASARKRSELVESPATRLKFKDFFRRFRQEEKESFQAAKKFGTECLDLLPDKIHWRVYLEMADLAKRENRIHEARKQYKRVTRLQPYAAQGWVEWAKMEEECGEFIRCQKILSLGLAYCPFNENLLVKGIRLHERLNNLGAARALLARFRNVTIDKAWKAMLEGAQLESRSGNVDIARSIFKFLIRNVPWYGPIYLEACRFEEKCEEYERAITIVEKGLHEIPRYGPLWFAAMRLHEKTFDLDRVRATIDRTLHSISRELLWKVYFEAAQVEDRGKNLERAREYYVNSVLHCQKNLRWKIWLGGARTEMNADNLDVSRQLLQRSLKEVPKKMRATVFIECSRIEEFAGNVEKARDILCRARQESRHEWKVFLESVLLEMRSGHVDAAITMAREALEIHTGTGRLWAVLIQLTQMRGNGDEWDLFYSAVREVPKSGEVWCEGARIWMNPLSPKFDLAMARRFLDFAVEFTPQYGDSFIEFLRLEMLVNGPQADTSALEQQCVNADPNYGSMWFHCKNHQLDSTRQVLRTAKECVCEELYHHRAVYQHAILRSQCNMASSLPPVSPIPGVSEARDFCTGITALNRRSQCTYALDPEERRKIIFGSDQAIPGS